MRIFYALVSSFIDLTNANRHLSLKGNDMQFPLVFFNCQQIFCKCSRQEKKKKDIIPRAITLMLIYLQKAAWVFSNGKRSERFLIHILAKYEVNLKP